MVKIRASCEIMGKSFSPKALLKKKGIQFSVAGEPGEIGQTGRYKGKPVPYGHGTIEVSEKAESDWSCFDDLLTTIEGCINVLREAGAEEICLSCSVFHDGQCNFAFSKTQLKRIAALEIDMPISCYGVELE